jgi:hypothetical protein
MKNESEFQQFKAGLSSILKADPKAVKAAMDEQKKERETKRKAKRALAYPASTAKA